MTKFITGIKISSSEDSIPTESKMRSARFSPPPKNYVSMIAGIFRQTDCQSCVRQLLGSVFLLSISFHPLPKKALKQSREYFQERDCDTSTKSIWYLCFITLIKGLQKIMQITKKLMDVSCKCHTEGCIISLFINEIF